MKRDGKVRLSGSVLRLSAALAVLGVLTAAFAESPLRQAIVGQLGALGAMRAPQLEELFGGAAAPNESRGSSPLIAVGHAEGFYKGPLRVALAAPEAAAIFYTLDGSVPTDKSARYVEPVWITRTALLSFRAKPSEGSAGSVERRTYLIDERDDVPVLSLSMDPAFLWNRHSGIYLNPFKRGVGWRRPAQAEYFEDRETPPRRFPVQMSIHGNWSRRADKKSFELNYTPPHLGSDRNGILDAAAEHGARRAAVVRAAAMDLSYRFGDHLFREVYGAAGGLVSPAVLVRLLLNGAAWGLYHLHAKIDQAFLQRLSGPGDYQLIDSAGYGRSEEDADWNRLLDFFTTRDLSQEVEFSRARRLVDVENFTDYWLFNIYAGNYDWPQSNYYAFRKRAPNEHWRWISWDADAAFDIGRGLHHDTLTWASRGEVRHDLSYSGDDIDFKHWLESTVIIRALLRHDGYRRQFMRRFCVLHDNDFEPRRLLKRFQVIVDRMSPHLGADWQRWPSSKPAYFKAVDSVRRFIRERPAIVLDHFRQRFGSGVCTGTV